MEAEFREKCKTLIKTKETQLSRIAPIPLETLRPIDVLILDLQLFGGGLVARGRHLMVPELQQRSPRGAGVEKVENDKTWNSASRTRAGFLGIFPTVGTGSALSARLFRRRRAADPGKIDSDHFPRKEKCLSRRGAESTRRECFG